MSALVITEFIVALGGLAVILSVAYVGTYGLKRPERKEDDSVILHNPRYIMYTQTPKRQDKQTQLHVRHNVQPQRRFS